MELITLHDKQFAPFISRDTIQRSVRSLADRMNSDYKGEHVCFVGVMNGAFRFVSDLMEHIELNCEVSFIKLASYEGTESTGKVAQLVGLSEDVKGKHVIVVEDIVDTGNTLEEILKLLEPRDSKSLKTATLLFKPEAYKKQLPIDYIGLEIGNDFIVGYGLDYDGLGRNLNQIYKIVE